MKTYVVTGTDRGLGLSIARNLLDAGNRVLATCLDPEGEGPRDLLQFPADRIHVITLDIANAESVRSAGLLIRSITPTLDCLINNAGILGDIEHTVGDPDLDFDDISKVIEVNAIGSLRMIHELWDLITKNETPLIVNISSEAGSISQNWRDRWFGYCMSKSALNMASALVHQRLRSIGGGRVMLVHPGYVKSYMHGSLNEAATYEPDEAAHRVLKAIKRYSSEKVSEQPDYFDLNGNRIHW